MPKTNKIGIILCAFLCISIAVAGCTSKQCTQEPYQEAYQDPQQVPYQEYVQTTVPVQYDWSYNPVSDIGFNWEITDKVYIHNVDSQGGTFSVTANFYEGNALRSTATGRDYIGPGESKYFYLESSGLSYSTDWPTRYTIVHNIIPPTKIQTTLVTKYRTEYITKYRTAYRQVCN